MISNKDHKYSDDDFDTLFYDQYQEEGRTTVRAYLAALSNKLKEENIDDIISAAWLESKIPIKKLKLIYYKMINEHNNKVEVAKARKKITKTTYRTFKETLCPVWWIFAWPYHTPVDLQDNDNDGQTIKGFAFNPYVLEENHK